MLEKNLVSPDYLFEVSWEVCNKVGGIHTVIATKAQSLLKEYKNNYILIGPDEWRDTEKNPEFLEENNLYKAWKARAAEEGLRVRIGRWNVPGKPIVILVDFSPFLTKKDEIFAELWRRYGLDSISGGWDYIESSLFGYTSGKVIESFINFNLGQHQKAVAQFHEWMTGAGILYLKSTSLPVATVFTTHATVAGRAIAGNNLPLYENLNEYNPAEKAAEFNIVSKHSLEKLAAANSDIFTTVSDITARECEHFLGKSPDIITPNGFDNSFVPKGEEFETFRREATEKMLQIASKMTGTDIDKEAFLICTGGRFEFKNKGIDLYLDMLGELNKSKELKRNIVAWLFVPSAYPDKDPIMRRINELNLFNREEDKVKLLIIPHYLNGDDGIFNLTYYQLLSGLDLTLFPSYYEPWGYTPLESLAFGVPTITTSLSGFGLWVKEHRRKKDDAIDVIQREDRNYDKVLNEIVKRVILHTQLSPEKKRQARESAMELAGTAVWDNFVHYYKEAYSLALGEVIKQKGNFPMVKEERDNINFKKEYANKPTWSKIIVTGKISEKLAHLEILAWNLWWCWNQEAIELFGMIDPKLWEESEGNPITLMGKLSLKKYKELEADNKFLKRLENVYKEFQSYMSRKEKVSGVKVAYFSMEYGLDKSLKIYSGGLGVLAGDYLKESSDMNIPITAVGLLYKYGYFTQKLSSQGDQVSYYEAQDFTKLPVIPVRDENGKWLTVKIALPGRNLHARIWRVDVGRIELYLLDTDYEKNLPEDRAVTHHLYGGDWENRFKQEMLLGIGGIRALRALRKDADVYHLNEGHAAFTGLERLREFVTNNNLTFSEALELVRSSSLYTTHTPVPAGHDTFSEEMVRAYFSHYPQRMKTTWEKMLSLGKLDPHNHEEKFSMSNLAASLSQEINGVSWLHGEVSRQILSPLWPGYLPTELHVGYVTNGVHHPTWTAPEWKEVYNKHFSKNFSIHRHDKSSFEGIYNVDASEIWRIRNILRSRLIAKIKVMLSAPQLTTHYTPEQIVKIKETLRDDILTVGFARRFATYKRALLLFRNIERLKKIANNKENPVQFIFAGKAHPADKAGQDLIKRIVEISLMPEFIGKILFIPGYDMTLAKYMIQGTDIWMNTPTRPLEASGTSGQKAVMNGVIHFSVLDGWWVEGYRKGAGWALPMERSYQDQNYQDELDAITIYNIFEYEIVPLFYNLNSEQLPDKWVDVIKESIAKVAVNFTTNRMLTDYIEKYYNKLRDRYKELIRDDFKKARDLALWKKRVKNGWPFIEILNYNKPDNSRSDILLGEEYCANLTISIGDLCPDDIGIEMLIALNGENGDPHIEKVVEFELEEYNSGTAKYSCRILADTAGTFSLAGRIYAKNDALPNRQDFDLIKWL